MGFFDKITKQITERIIKPIAKPIAKQFDEWELKKNQEEAKIIEAEELYKSVKDLPKAERDKLYNVSKSLGMAFKKNKNQESIVGTTAVSRKNNKEYGI